MTKQNDKNQGEKQLDLFKYVVQLWDDRRIVIWTMAACVVIGLLSYIMRPTKYSTRATLLPSYASSESSLGNLGALASLAGVNVGGGTGGISPDLYPTVSQSVPYLLELINVPLDSEDSDRAMTLLDIAKACAEASTTERYYKFASTSKVTLPLNLMVSANTVLWKKPTTMILYLKKWKRQARPIWYGGLSVIHGQNT